MAKLPMRRDLGFDQDPARRRLSPSPGQTGFLFVVADGVGAVPCGERASSIAVRSLHRFLKDQSRILVRGKLEIIRMLRRGITRCQSDLQAEGRLHPECDGMSTTLTGILSLARRLFVVHSGDSRCYVLRGSNLILVTRDHTQAQLNIEAGTVDRNAAKTSPGGNFIWNYLTSDSSTLRPDVGSMPLEPGDILLACTDGLSDALPAKEIKQHLSSRIPAEGICKALIAAARISGGGDDLTAIVARFDGLA
jgi:protein phosphatase